MGSLLLAAYEMPTASKRAKQGQIRRHGMLVQQTVPSLSLSCENFRNVAEIKCNAAGAFQSGWIGIPRLLPHLWASYCGFESDIRWRAHHNMTRNRARTSWTAGECGTQTVDEIMSEQQIKRSVRLPDHSSSVGAESGHTDARANGIVASSILSTAAPWSDLITLRATKTVPGCWFEQCYSGYRIALRQKGPVRIQFKLLGDRIQSETFVPGDLCFLTPGAIERLCLRDSGEALLATISPSFMRNLSLEIAGKESIEIASARRYQDVQIAQKLLVLESELRNGCPGGRLYGECIVTALVVHILHHYAHLQNSIPRYRDGLSAAKLQRVVDFVQQHIEEDIALQKLAELVHMSPFHFVRMFKQRTGVTPHRYLTAQRIERAKKLLKNQHLAIAEVAYAVGFPSQSHFTFVFSKLVGTTPGAYRRNVYPEMSASAAASTLS